MWKYTVVELSMERGDDLSLVDDLNEFGKNGWELVCMVWRDCDIHRTNRIICTFKRPVNNNEVK